MERVPLKARTKFGYGIGNFGIICATNAVIIYLFYFYTDVVVFPPLLVSLALAIPRFWDAFSDPMMGIISDRTKFSSGRRRPYIFWGTPVLVLSFILLWYPFTSGGAGLIFSYMLVANLLFTTSITIVSVPYMSLGGELSPEYHERTTVFAYSQAFGMIGGLFGAAMKLFADYIPLPNERLCYFVSAALMSVPIFVFLWWTFFATKENYLPEKEREHVSLKKMLIANLKNHSFRNLMLTMMISSAGMMFSTQLLPLMLKYWIKLDKYIFHATALYTFAVFLAFPLWKKIGEKHDKKTVMTFAFIGAGISYSLSFFMFRPGSAALMFSWAVLIGLFGAGGILYPFSMIADIADEDELNTGTRSEGIFYGTFSFIQKLTIACGSGMSGIVLWLSGFKGGAETQTAKTLFMLRMVYVIPAVSFFISAALIYFSYTLTEEKVKRIKAELDIRKREGGQGQ